MNKVPTNRPIDPGVDIGHVHLKVADLERALDFYCGVLGFELMTRYGAEAAFVSAGGYHHHIGLNTWESRGGHPPSPGTTGLYHFAIRYPDRADLADALRRLRAAKIPLEGAADHGVSEALYLRDPWPRPEAPARAGRMAMDSTGSPLKTALNFTGIARAKNGRKRRMEKSKCTPGRWIRRTCLLKLFTNSKLTLHESRHFIGLENFKKVKVKKQGNGSKMTPLEINA